MHPQLGQGLLRGAGLNDSSGGQYEQGGSCAHGSHFLSGVGLKIKI